MERTMHHSFKESGSFIFKIWASYLKVSTSPSRLSIYIYSNMIPQCKKSLSAKWNPLVQRHSLANGERHSLCSAVIPEKWFLSLCKIKEKCSRVYLRNVTRRFCAAKTLTEAGLSCDALLFARVEIPPLITIKPVSGNTLMLAVVLLLFYMVEKLYLS